MKEAVNCQLCPVLSVVALRIRMGTLFLRRQFCSRGLNSICRLPSGCLGQTKSLLSQRFSRLFPRRRASQSGNQRGPVTGLLNVGSFVVRFVLDVFDLRVQVPARKAHRRVSCGSSRVEKSFSHWWSTRRGRACEYSVAHL